MLTIALLIAVFAVAWVTVDEKSSISQIENGDQDTKEMFELIYQIIGIVIALALYFVFGSSIASFAGVIDFILALCFLKSVVGLAVAKIMLTHKGTRCGKHFN